MSRAGRAGPDLRIPKGYGMKSKDQNQPPAADEPAGRPAKRAGDSGSVNNSNPGEKRDAIASETKTTRRLDGAVKRDADGRMAGVDKALGRWEGEGGATPPAQKGGRK